MESDLEADLLRIFDEISDSRSLVNAVNNLIKASLTKPSPSSPSFNNPLLAEKLLGLFIRCLGKHPTVLDIMQHVLDTLVATGSPRFLDNLSLALNARWDRMTPGDQLSLLDVLARFSTGRSLLRRTDCRVAKAFVEGNLLLRLDEWGRCCGQYDCVAKEVKEVDYLERSLDLVGRILREQTASDSAEMIIQDSLLHRLERLFRDYLTIPTDRHPNIKALLSQIVLTLAEHFDTINAFQTEIFSDLGNALSPLPFPFILAGLIDRMSLPECLEHYDRILQCIHLSDRFSDKQVLICMPVFLSFVKKLQNVQKTQYLSDAVSACWSVVSTHPSEAVQCKIVDFLRIIAPVWKFLSEDVQKDIVKGIQRLPWSSGCKLRCYVLLNIDRTTFFRLERKRPLDLLEMIPDKFYKAPLNDLIIQIADVHDIAEILVKTPRFSPFLMRSVLPTLAKRTKSFLMDLFALLKQRGCVVGYGPVLYTIRVTKLPVDGGMVLREYVCGNVDLAVIADDTVRMEAFAFFCEHADPVSQFRRFVYFVAKNIDHQFSRFREPFLRSAGQFLQRFSSIFAQNKKKFVEKDVAECLLQYSAFFLDLLTFDCSSTSSYARRTSALQLLKTMVNSSHPVDVSNGAYRDTIGRSLLEQLFWESFPDNQLLIIAILTALSRQSPPTWYADAFSLDNLSVIADQQAQSCGSNAARLSVNLDVLTKRSFNDLLGRLEKSAETAVERGIQWTAKNSPVYGEIYRLRCALERQKVGVESVERAMGVCWRIAEFINGVYADHSQDLSMDRSAVTEDDEATTAQMLIVCCWRCIREVSLLLTELTIGKFVNPGSITAIKEVFLWNISHLFVTRHTGTFETMAEQIQKLASVLLENGEAGKAIIMSSLNDIVQEVTGEWSSPLRPENTRRSAGIPRLWCILYSSVRRTETGEESFAKITEILFSMSSGAEDRNIDESSRVRCINILEAVFRENTLNELSEKYVGRGFILSCEGMTSKIWSIHNSSACLFSGLVQRVFGPGVKKPVEELQFRESCLSAGEFFGLYPEVFDYALQALRKVGERDFGRADIFSLLLILSKLYGNADDPVYLKELTGPIYRMIKSLDFRVREVAARALVGLFGQEIFRHLLGVSNAESAGANVIVKTENEKHGLLLVLKEYFSSTPLNAGFRPLTSDLKDFVERLLTDLCVSSLSYFSAALFLDVVELFLRNNEDVSDSFVSEFIRRLDRMLANVKHTEKFRHGFSVFVRSLCSVTATRFHNPYVEKGVRGVFYRFLDGMDDPVSNGIDTETELSLKIMLLAKCAENGIFPPEPWKFIPERYTGHPNTIKHCLTFTTAVLSVFSDCDITVRTRQLDSVLHLVEREVRSEILIAAFKTAARILETRNTSERIYCRWLACVDEKFITGNGDLRLTCAEGFPRLVLEEDASVFCQNWIIVLKLLRDDDMKVRTAMASRLKDFGLTDHPCTANHAVYLIIDHLVEAALKNNQIDIVLAILTAEFINDDDRIVQSEDTDTTIFENCDRHEYHENLHLFRLLRDAVVRATQKREPTVRECSGAVKRFLESLAREMTVCFEYLRDSEFLDDVSMDSRMVFRLVCSLLVVECFQLVGVEFEGLLNAPVLERMRKRTARLSCFVHGSVSYNLLSDEFLAVL